MGCISSKPNQVEPEEIQPVKFRKGQWRRFKSFFGKRRPQVSPIISLSSASLSDQTSVSDYRNFLGAGSFDSQISAVLANGCNNRDASNAIEVIRGPSPVAASVRSLMSRHSPSINALSNMTYRSSVTSRNMQNTHETDPSQLGSRVTMRNESANGSEWSRQIHMAEEEYNQHRLIRDQYEAKKNQILQWLGSTHHTSPTRPDSSNNDTIWPQQMQRVPQEVVSEGALFITSSERLRGEKEAEDFMTLMNQHNEGSTTPESEHTIVDSDEANFYADQIINEISARNTPVFPAIAPTATGKSGGFHAVASGNRCF